MGPRTRRGRIETFQQTHVDPTSGKALAVDGVVGPRTRAALSAALGIG